jgi:hypothetical protein
VRSCGERGTGSIPTGAPIWCRGAPTLSCGSFGAALFITAFKAADSKIQRKSRNHDMTDENNWLDQNEPEILVGEMSDEALEAAACSGAFAGRSFTIAMCTGQAECPF